MKCDPIVIIIIIFHLSCIIFTLVTVSAIVFIFVFSAVSNRAFQRLHAHIKPLRRSFMLLHWIRVSLRLDASLSSRPQAQPICKFSFLLVF